MSIRAELFNWLVGDPGVAGVVKDRIYPQIAPQGTERPYIVTQFVTGGQEHHQLGAATLADVLVQVTAYADTSVGAEALGDLVKLRLDGFRGSWGAEDIRWVALRSERDTFERTQDARQGGIYSIQQDYHITYTRPVPVFS